MRTEMLAAAELAKLFHQAPETKNDGGFQSLLVRLQSQVRGNVITLEECDIERICRYSSYCPGGWEDTYLRGIFGRFDWFPKV